MSNTTDGQEVQKVEINIQRIYTKDVSFESPGAPRVFTQNVQPQIHLEVSTNHQKLDNNLFEVSLTVTASAKQKEETIFIAEVEQCGIFTINGAPAETLRQILGAYCPNILFPYVRETIDALTTRGSFPALMIAPINFEMLYQQQRSQSKPQAT